MFDSVKNWFEEAAFNRKRQEGTFARGGREHRRQNHDSHHQQHNRSEYRRQNEDQGQKRRRATMDESLPEELAEAMAFFSFRSKPTAAALKKRYKTLSTRYHPDKTGGDTAKMQQLNHYKAIISQYL